MQKQATMESLPQELIEEILVRLPVKSLLRFKCVSKSWRSLISDPHFADLHFQRSSQSQHAHRIFLTIAWENRSIDLNASLYDNSAVVSLRSFTLLHAAIGGSCRGFLLLLVENAYFYIWNPSTDISMKIPLPPLWQINECLYGFGYDASTDDYLIVVASSDPYKVALLEIFSLRTNSWTKLEGLNLPSIFPVHHPDLVCGSFLNGAIHWLAMRLETPQVSNGSIIAFDLTKRNLREVPMPDDHDSKYGELKVLEGYLSLVGWITVDQNEIWVMREYGVKSSWTKHITMSVSEFPYAYFSPTCFTRDGHVVGVDGCTGLIKCNDKGELLEHRQYSPNQKHYESRACVYTESLLSLPCDHWEKVEHRQ